MFENWTGAEDTSDGRENLLVCGPTEKAAEYFKKKKGKKEKEKTFDAVLMNTPFGYTREGNKGRVRLGEPVPDSGDRLCGRERPVRGCGSRRVF